MRQDESKSDHAGPCPELNRSSHLSRPTSALKTARYGQLTVLSWQGTWQQTCLSQLSFSWERTAGVGIKSPCVYQAPPFFCPFTFPSACPVPNQCLARVVSQSSITHPNSPRKLH